MVIDRDREMRKGEEENGKKGVYIKNLSNHALSLSVCVYHEEEKEGAQFRASYTLDERIFWPIIQLLAVTTVEEREEKMMMMMMMKKMKE